MASTLRRPRFYPLLAGLLLAGLVILAHSPAIVGGFVWDDDDNLTANEAVLSASGLPRIWLDVDDVPPYYPMARSALWLQHATWGLNPLGYHLVSVLLQALNALLLWRVLLRLELPGAWLAAAVFGVHPLQVESVAWITEQKNLLSASFAFAALLAWIRFRSAEGSGRRRMYALCIVLFIAAMLTKTTVVCFPVALLLIAWWKNGRVAGREVGAILPMLAIGGGLGLFTAWLERNAVGAAGADWDWTLVDRVLIAGRALWFYAVKLVWPHPVLYVYPRWSIDSGALLPNVVVALALAVPGLLWWMRKRIGRGPVAAVAFYGAAIFPALGFINVYYMRYSFVADRWQYLPGIGLIVLIVAAGSTRLAGAPRASRAVLLVLAAGASGLLLVTGFGAWAIGAVFAVAAIVAGVGLRIVPRLAPTRTAAGALVLVTLSVISFRQAQAYQTEEGLWRHTLAGNPAAAVAHHNLGAMLLARGDTAEALDRLLSAESLDPELTETQNNLGIALYRLGRGDEAIAHYRAALRLNPDFADAHTNLGISLAEAGQWPDALQHLQEAARLRPDLSSARFNLGQALLQQGRTNEAADQLSEAARLDPGDVATRLAAAQALSAADRPREAVSMLRGALKLDPNRADTMTALAWLLATARQPEVRSPQEAVALAERVAAAAPDDPRALELLAVSHASAGEFDSALRAATRGEQLARRAGNEPLARRLAERAVQYRQGLAPSP